MSVVGYVIPARSYRFIIAVWSAKAQNLAAMKLNTLCLLVFALLSYFGSTPAALEAVVPPPDGGYPGNNTAEGQNALLSLSVNNGD